MAAASPRQLAEAANFDDVHSGELEVALRIGAQGEAEGANMRLLGIFMKAGEENPPELDMALESNGTLAGRRIEFSSGLTLLSDRAVAFYDPQTYQPDHVTFQKLKSKYEKAQEPGDEGNAMACVDVLEGLQPSELIWRPTDSGRRQELDGTHVTWVEAELDVSSAIDALVQMAKDKACGAQLRAAGVSSAAQLEAVRGAAEEAVDETNLLFTVDSHAVPREVSVDVVAKGEEGKEWRLEGDYRLTRVNEITELPVPSGAAPFPNLLKRFDTTLAALQTADGGELLGAFLEGIGKSLTGR